MKYKIIDIENWYRKDIFHFYKNYDDPFINITANVEVTNLLALARREKSSFFLNILYCSIKIANQIPEFKLRLQQDQLAEYEYITAGSTVLNPDNSFSFCYFDHFPERKDFLHDGVRKMNAVKANKGIDPQADVISMIHYSVVPWVSFTSLKHARIHNNKDTIPKIVFGKYFKSEGKMLMPLSVEVHHSMMDGYHIGLYFEQFQQLIDRVGQEDFLSL